MLLVKSVLLVLPFALIFSLLEYELRQIPNGYSTTKAEIEERSDRLEVLITGMSHTQNAVRADLLDCQAFNLAYGSQSLYYDTQLVLKYAPAMPRLKLVIFTISYPTLEYRLNNTIERWRTGFYQQVYGIPNEDAGQRRQLTNYSYIALYTPKEAYRQVLTHFTAPKAAGKGPSISNEGSRQNEMTDDFGKLRVRLHESEMRETDMPANRAALEHACQVLRARQVAIAFMTVPAHHTYYDNIDPAIYRRMQETIRQLSADCQAEYFNYFFDARFADGDFVNSDHLNSMGAAKFSRIINEDIITKYLHGAGATTKDKQQ